MGPEVENFNEYAVSGKGPARETTLSFVYKAKKDNLLFAIKTPKSGKHNEHLIKSAMLQRSLRHPGIVRVFEWGIENKTGQPFVVMEYVGQLTLDYFISGKHKLLPRQKLHVICGVAGAMAYAHSANVLHRDINPRNIFAGRTARITDFNAGNEPLYFHDSIDTSEPLIIDPEYAAPEGIASKEADVYSLVLCALELFGERKFCKELGLSFKDFAKEMPPFISEKLESIFENGISEKPLRRPAMARIESGLRGLLEQYDSYLSSSGRIEFMGSPAFADYALQKMRTGNTSEAIQELEEARRLFPENSEITRMLAIAMINMGDFNGAYELIGDNSVPETQMLLSAALMLGHPKKRRLLKTMGMEEISSAVASANPFAYRRVKRHPAVSNEFAIAAALNKDPAAIRIFQELLSNGADQNAINNNMGVAYAILNNETSIDCFQKSQSPQARINHALFVLQHTGLGFAYKFASSLDSSAPERLLLKAQSMMHAAKKTGDCPMPALAERYARREVLPSDYEFIT